MGVERTKERLIEASIRQMSESQRTHYTYQTQESARLDSQDLQRIRTRLIPLRDKIDGVTIAQRAIGDSEIPALCALLESLPNIKTLDLRYNPISNAGWESMIPTLAKMPALRNIKLVRNNIEGAEGGEVVKKLIEAVPQLYELELMTNNLGDEGIEVLAPVIARNRNLLSIGLKHNCDTPYGRTILRDALHQNRHLAMVSVGNDQMPEAEIKLWLNTVLYGDNKNMVTFLPNLHPLNGHLSKRQQAGQKMQAIVLQDPATHDYAQTAKIYTRHGMLRCDYGRHAGAMSRALDAFEAHIATLPAIPQTGLPDALFEADANGYAPLDNPENWLRAAPIFNALEKAGVNVDDAFLNRRTPRGVSFIESAIQAAPIAELVRCLNEQDVQIDEKWLLDGKKPSALLEHLISDNDAPKLFTGANWKHSTPSEFNAAFMCLPPEQRERVGNVHGIRAQLADNQHTQAYGR